MVFVDNYITRRKLFHVVYDGDLKRRFRSRLLGDCINFLHAEGIEEYELRWPGQAPLTATGKIVFRKES